MVSDIEEGERINIDPRILPPNTAKCYSKHEMSLYSKQKRISPVVQLRG